jgi:hypothetical protein
MWLDLQIRFESEPEFFSKMITDDETWGYGYDPEVMEQSCRVISTYKKEQFKFAEM